MKLENYYKIPTFDEAMAIVDKEKAFSHSMQVINGQEVHSFKYNLSYPDMWDNLEDGRLNLRGITFIDKKLVALPFPKFFNLGENKHVQPSDIDVSSFNIACEKVDGSLISFFKVGDNIEVKTMKSVYSDTAIEVREFVKDRPDILNFSKLCIEKDISPIFEYISNTDVGRIVIDYNKKDLVLLGARNMINGIIYTIQTIPLDIPNTITKVKEFTTNTEVKDYLTQSGVEGIVLTLSTGLMIKLKTEWYCKIHRLMDLLSVKNIVDSIVSDTIDDSKSILLQNGMAKHVDTIILIENKFYELYNEFYNSATAEYINRKHLGETKKDIAMTLLKENKILASLVFALYDGKDISLLIKPIVKDILIQQDLSSFVKAVAFDN